MLDPREYLYDGNFQAIWTSHSMDNLFNFFGSLLYASKDIAASGSCNVKQLLPLKTKQNKKQPK